MTLFLPFPEDGHFLDPFPWDGPWNGTLSVDTDCWEERELALIHSHEAPHGAAIQGDMGLKFFKVHPSPIRTRIPPLHFHDGKFSEALNLFGHADQFQ